MDRRVTLVGYRASGKSTIGRLLARRLDWPFIDADALLETRLGCAVAAYFAKAGETAFREHEAAALGELLSGDGSFVLATGGGAVLRRETRDLLRARGGTVVYLQAAASELQARLRQDAGGRPSLTGAAVADEVTAVLATREPFYREVADHVIAASEAPEALAERIAALLV